MLIGGIVGDGHLLGRIFPGGAISALYAPGIASARHILQSNLGLYWKDERRFLWLTGTDGLCAQSYEAGAGVLVTRFHYDDVRAELRDFVDPETHVLVRRVRLTNPQPHQLNLALFHLEASSIAENKEDFSNNFAEFSRGTIARYRGHAFDNAREHPVSVVIGFAPAPRAAQCGISYRREGNDMDAHYDAEDGELRGNAYAFHHALGVTSAVSWDVALAQDETGEVVIYFTGDYDLSRCRDRVAAAQEAPAASLESEVASGWNNWLAQSSARARVGESIRERQWWDRSASVLRLLQDASSGAFIAAPSVNPDYRYCWPRDAALIADAMSELGYIDEVARFYCWCARAQADSGVWFQNYYVDGRRHWPALQVDQVGTVVWSMCRHLHRHGHELLDELWTSLERATEALLRRVTEDKSYLAWSEQDLWEESSGWFLYTNAAVVAAFREAALLAARADRAECAARWGAAATRMQDSVEHHFQEQGAFVAALDPDLPRPARKDCRLDISMLGVVFPFEVVHAKSPLVTATIDHLVSAFSYEAGGLGRYPDDRFFGGNPWPLADLWLAHVHRLRDERELAQHRLDHVARRMTPLGFIPEQNNKHSAEPTSVIPLGWAHAWLLQLLARP